MRRRSPLRLAPALVAALWPMSALAHQTPDMGSSFLGGFLHPFTGIDHLLAMLAVGLWGAQLGAPAIWALPVAFPLVMALGGVVGIVGLPLPGVETAIALSVVVLGAAIALDRRPPLPVACGLVAVFAVFHGYAHGLELPKQAAALAYCAGFVLATGTIHLSGIGLGLGIHWRHGLRLLRAGGSAISLVGVVLFVQLLAR
jgi:urease accessory protein